jgi:hypothetical protein
MAPNCVMPAKMLLMIDKGGQRSLYSSVEIELDTSSHACNGTFSWCTPVMDCFLQKVYKAVDYVSVQGLDDIWHLTRADL